MKKGFMFKGGMKNNDGLKKKKELSNIDAKESEGRVGQHPVKARGKY